MNLIQIVLLIVSCYTSLNQAASLPEFITPCKGTDPNLNECAYKEANKAIPDLLKGYPALNIPVLSPLQIQQIKVSNGGFNIVIDDAVVRGLDETKASNFNIDLKTHHVKLRVTIPNLNIQGEYEMSGQLLVLPLKGKGPCNITVVNGDYDIDILYSLYDQGGVVFSKLEKVDVELDIKGASVYFANLLNSSKQISDDINGVLNKEWKQVIKDLTPAIKDAVALIVIQVVNGIVDKIPYAEIWGGAVPSN
ncbi:protein takeout-like [Chrysoperla carnea]|uniref:protein takeout-like n=1 Tax=Chrysoperla carnea TaxID=189513 RepID=UPI001D07EB14|nr:protein takeout-like [Chrysoperla carnea]